MVGRQLLYNVHLRKYSLPGRGKRAVPACSSRAQARRGAAAARRRAGPAHGLDDALQSSLQAKSRVSRKEVEGPEDTLLSLPQQHSRGRRARRTQGPEGALLTLLQQPPASAKAHETPTGPAAASLVRQQSSGCHRAL